MDPGEDPDDILRANRSREKTFVFDMVFDHRATQVTSFPFVLTKRLNIRSAFPAEMDVLGK